MKNKLTNEKLKQLIREVLNESTKKYDIYVTSVPTDIDPASWRNLDKYAADNPNTQQHKYSFQDKDTVEGFLIELEKILKKYGISSLSFGALSPDHKNLKNYIGGYLTVKKQFTGEDEFKKFKAEALALLSKRMPNASANEFRINIHDETSAKMLDDSTAYVSVPATYDQTTLDNLITQVSASKNANELKTAKDNLTDYYTKFSADIDKDVARKTKYDNALVAKFKFDKAKFDKLYKALEDASKLTDQTAVDNAKKAITDYYNNTGAKDSASDANFANVPNFKAAFDMTAYNKKKAALDAEIKKNKDEVKINKALSDLQTYYAANKAAVDAADSNASTAIAALKKEATDAIDALKNVWKQDALGDVDPKYINDTTKNYTDPDRQKILVALRKAFSGVLTKTQLKHLASLSEARLHENPNALEFDDIIALYDRNPDDVFKGKATNLDVATKIDSALKTYINNLKDRAKAADIFQAKKEYDAMLATSRGLKPSKTPERSGTAAMPSTSQIGGDTRAPVDPVVFQSFETFFKGKSGVNKRIKHLSKFSKAVAKAAAGNPNDLNKYNPEIIFTGGNVLSILSRMTRQFDSSAAGYIAEAFLAFLVAGEKLGQKGKAEDFVAGKRLYSAKWGQKSKCQAKSNFNVDGQIITYIAANKTTVGGVGTSITMAISKATLSIYDVYTEKPNQLLRKADVGDFGTTYPENKSKKNDLAGVRAKNCTKSTDFDVSPPPNVTSFEIEFVTAEDETFDEVFSKAMAKVTNDLALAATEFNSKSKELNELTTTYTVSGDFSEGVAMAKVYNNIKGILDRIAIGKGSTSTEIGLTENKTKSLKDLDKLIERVILENMNKK